MRKAVTLMAGSAVLMMAPLLFAGYSQGFEDPGWTAGSDSGDWQNYVGGDIVRVTSGTNGITSSDGSAHAIITNLAYNDDVFGNPSLGTGGPYTRLGGYSNSFGGGFSASMDVFLDPAWSVGSGFDYSVAVNNQAGGHLRDWIAHVGKTDQGLLVNASNNSDQSFNDWKLENENGGAYGTVSQAGWYTLQHVFYDNGGDLAVDFKLLDDGGSELWSVTRTSSDDIATTVGGNRYGWLVFNNIDSLAVDNTALTTSVVPVPGAFLLVPVGLAFAGWLRRRFA